MAKVNTEALGRIDTQREDDDPRLTPVDYSPPLDLRMAARNLGAFDITGQIGRFDPERITMKQKSQMRRDPQIALGLHVRLAMLVNSPWHMECEDPQVAAFATHALEAIYARLVPQMFMALEFGFQPIVKRFKHASPTWTYEDPEDESTKPVWPESGVQAIIWDDFRTVPPEGAEVVLRADKKTFAGFKHNLITNREGRELVVPPTHALWVVYGFDHNFGDWYGYPLTGYAFRYWWSYWYQWLLADRHMEQDADPPVKASYPPGNSPDPDNPSALVPNVNVALKAGQMLRDGATVAVPSDYYEVDTTGNLARGARKWDIEFIKGGENIKAFHDSFKYLDVMKLRSVLVPDQALAGAAGSLSGTVVEEYRTAMAESQVLMSEWLDQHINDYMIPDLLAQNFIDPPDCRKVTDRFRAQDVELGHRLLEIVTASDPSSTQIDYRELAQRSDMPTLTPEEVEEAKQEREEMMRKEAEFRQTQPFGGDEKGARGTDNSTSSGRNNESRSRIADARDNAKEARK
jgi:hypothetical protein